MSDKIYTAREAAEGVRAKLKKLVSDRLAKSMTPSEAVVAVVAKDTEEGNGGEMTVIGDQAMGSSDSEAPMSEGGSERPLKAFMKSRMEKGSYA